MIQAVGRAVAEATVGGFTVNSLEGFTVGIGTLALINAGLAQSKNRSGLVWFLLSLPLGPVATLLLVAFSDRVPGRGEGG